MIKSKDEILDNIAQEYLNKEYPAVGDWPGRTNDPYYDSHEDEGRHYAESQAYSIYVENGKTLSEYDLQDEFITDEFNHYIPLNEWKDYVDFDTAIAYVEQDMVGKERGKDVFIEEYLDIWVQIRLGKGIEISMTTIKERLIDYISEDIDDYFEFMWCEEAKNEKAISTKRKR